MQQSPFDKGNNNKDEVLKSKPSQTADDDDDDEGNKSIMLICADEDATTEDIKLAFDEIESPELLRAQLTEKEMFDHNALIFASQFHSSSPEIMKLIFDKIVEAAEGDNDFLINQLEAVNVSMMNCFLLVCRHSSSAQVIKLVLEKAFEAGGKELVQTQLETINESDQNCIMLMLTNESLSFELMDSILRKIVEVGDADMLKSLLSAVDDGEQNCLVFLCSNPCLTIELVDLIFQKIIELDDVATDLLASLLAATAASGHSCLSYLCWNGECPLEVFKAILGKIVEAGGIELLKSQLAASFDEEGTTCFMRLTYSSPCIVQLVASLLHHFELFKQQYEESSDEFKSMLKEKVNIEDASWNPDPESVAEVKELLLTVAS